LYNSLSNPCLVAVIMTRAERRKYEQKVEFDIQSEVLYYSLDAALSTRLRSIAQQRGVSPETLLNLWVQEKLQSETSS